jgi:hypothetical protein
MKNTYNKYTLCTSLTIFNIITETEADVTELLSNA